jgi:hypothetical protein
MCELRDDAPTVARATMRPGVVRPPFSWRVRRYPVSLVRRTLHKAAHPPERPPHIPGTLEQRGACGGPSHASILHPVDSGACAGAQEQPFGAINPKPSPKPQPQPNPHPSPNSPTGGPPPAYGGGPPPYGYAGPPPGYGGQGYGQGIRARTALTTIYLSILPVR